MAARRWALSVRVAGGLVGAALTGSGCGLVLGLGDLGDRPADASTGPEGGGPGRADDGGPLAADDAGNGADVGDAAVDLDGGESERSVQECPVGATVDVPTITASGTSFCAGGNVTLSTSGASSYLWSNGATTASVVVSTAGTYTVTATYANGCSATSTGTAVTPIAVPHSSQTFNYTGAAQTFNVPTCVTSIGVVAYGAAGGPAASAGLGITGGLGGEVRATLTVTMSTLQVFVGGAGPEAPASGGTAPGGYNGGGSSANIGPSGGGGSVTIVYFAGSGGGASDLRVGAGALSDRILVAGGGGGAGGEVIEGSQANNGAGGAGGGLIGQGTIGAVVPMSGATGGTQSAGGGGGSNSAQAPPSSAPGVLGTGGAGTCGGPAAGGGGGYYGGGGGCEDGAGGGSSYVSSSLGSSVVHTQGVQSGNGQVIISW